MGDGVFWGYWQLAIGDLLWVIGYWRWAMGDGLLAIGDGLLAMGYWRWDFNERIILPIVFISISSISRISLDIYPKSSEISN